jgi:hypothetical protein
LAPLSEGTTMINNKKTVSCERCGGPADLLMVADGFDDAPASFVMTRTCHRGCEKLYVPMTAKEMHDSTKLPLQGWSETRY